MEKQELQEQIDVKKWLDSESHQRDMCGQYGYCDYCDTTEDYPCASAQIRMVNPSKTNRVLTFSERLQNADDTLKERYEILSEALLSGKQKVKSRISKHFDSYHKGKRVFARLSIIGRSLRIYLALDPTADNLAKYPHRDVSGIKLYADTPFMLKISSDLALKRALALIKMVP